MLKTISHFCRGASHLDSGKPCQDCATAEVKDGMAVAIVSDGHGGDRYFRSDVGSRLLVDITRRALIAFGEYGGGPQPYRFFTSDEINDSKAFVKDVVDKRLRWLFSSIIAQWNEAISAHAEATPLTEWELEHVPEKYRQEFLKGDTLEKTYGCTLMAYLQTSTYWTAFHIGDGKLLTLNLVNGSLEWQQPVPWDDKCFLNKTTSICDSKALEEFRYCFCNDGTFPLAVFLGSDGIDDTYGDGAMLEAFYCNVYKLLATKGDADTLKELRKALPLISKRGSKDDMSVAVVYDDSHLRSTLVLLTEQQLQRTVADYEDALAKIRQCEETIAGKRGALAPTEADRIAIAYAQKDLDKALTRKKRLAGKKGQLSGYLNRLKSEK